jgi:hypothetical protein
MVYYDMSLLPTFRYVKTQLKASIYGGIISICINGPPDLSCINPSALKHSAAAGYRMLFFRRPYSDLGVPLFTPHELFKFMALGPTAKRSYSTSQLD